MQVRVLFCHMHVATAKRQRPADSCSCRVCHLCACNMQGFPQTHAAANLRSRQYINTLETLAVKLHLDGEFLIIVERGMLVAACGHHHNS